MIDYSLIALILIYWLVFLGMQQGRQPFLVSLMWPGMLGVLLAERLHEREKRRQETTLEDRT